MTRNQDDNAIETKVAAKQTLALAANDITLIDDETQIARVLVQKDITQTVALIDVQDQVTDDKEINIAALSSVFKAQEDVKVSEKVVSAVDSMIQTPSQEKNVVTPEQNSQLRSSLYTEFLSQNMKSLLVAHREGDDQSISRNIQSLQSNIISLYKSFGIAAQDIKADNAPFTYTIRLVQDLQSSLDAEYYIPPRYIQNMKTIINWLDYIAAQPYASQKDGKIYLQEVVLPTHLSF